MKRAFTMVEMLVAMAATLIMVLFLGQIFTAMQGAASAGKATSVIIENSRVLSPQLVDDAAARVGPGGGGFLVILQQGLAGVPLAKGSPSTINTRSDQIMWIRTTAGASISPGRTDSFDDLASGAGNARVWYGHGLRTRDDGGEPASALLSTTPAADWVLCRQALYLAGGLPATPVAGSKQFYAADAQAASLVNFDVPPADPQAAPLRLYRGMTDLCAQSLAALTGTGGIFVGDNYLSVPAYTFATDRLRVNPIPMSSESWQVGQAHPFIADHVTFFSVEFTGDYNDEGTDAAWATYWTAKNAARPPGSPPIVPSNYTVDRTAGYAGTDKNGVAFTVAADLMMWYTSDPFANDPRYINPIAGTGYPGYDSTLPLAFRCNTAATPPFDTTFTASDRPVYQTGLGLPNADSAFVFRHGSTAPNWPAMIRLRYRLTDARGTTTGSDGNPGKAFEQIIR